MRIAVLGAGGVGGYFGARLGADGNDVTFVARGAHAAAMRERGLKVLSPMGALHLAPVMLHDDWRTTGLVDIVLVAIKMYDLDEAAATVKPLLSADTAVVPFQNGVEAQAILERVLGRRYVCGGAAYIFAAIEAPGVIRHTGEGARLVFGEPYNAQGASVRPEQRKTPRAPSAVVLGTRLPKLALSGLRASGDLQLALAFKLPTSIAYPRPSGKGRGSLAVIGAAIERRQREAGVTWEPRRFLADVAALVDENYLDQWLAWAEPGAIVAYYLGDSLAADRLEDETLDLLARAVLARAAR